MSSLTGLWCRLRHQHSHNRTRLTLPNGYQFTAVWCDACGRLSVSPPFNPFTDVEQAKYGPVDPWDRDEAEAEVALIAKELRSFGGESDSPEKDLAFRVEAIGYKLRRKDDLLRKQESSLLGSWLCWGLLISILISYFLLRGK